VLDILCERFGFDVREIAGASASGEIPVGEALVNRLIAQRLAGHAQIAAVHVAAESDDALSVHVVPRARLVPSIRIAARIEQQPDVPQNPTFVLRWSMAGIGRLAMFAAPVLAYFTALPAGIRIDRDRVVVDLRDLLHARGHQDAIGLIRTLEIRTRPGAFLVRFAVGVDE
jgi:hypothetical protein